MTFTQREAPFPRFVAPRLSDEAQLWMSMPISDLKEKLKAERRRGLEGHWTYNLTRHRLMLKTYSDRLTRCDCQVRGRQA